MVKINLPLVESFSMKLVALGFLVTFVGFVLVLLGALLSTSSQVPSSLAGAIFIGPFPIIFGSGTKELFGPFLWVFATISVILVALYLVSIALFLKGRRSGPGGI
ncbi:hypothetical protein HS1genome_0859 [Sulfodiicoccus acidiphilus]|uniref:DUF131 domain-containing protein n=3 Tax=Sulfodiicoccus acidiphilus TaxID=1670455 RepID=A0A348B2R8_9CREN|nr:hypothetical protein HS1genome_0859 [Sulfodiicoccus acidiphilus]GGT96905.1 hypothetical protein GCM10007116_13000 [Sulfodiicoccus acidiphilus]